MRSRIFPGKFSLFGLLLLLLAITYVGAWNLGRERLEQEQVYGLKAQISQLAADTAALQTAKEALLQNENTLEVQADSLRKKNEEAEQKITQLMQDLAQLQGSLQEKDQLLAALELAQQSDKNLIFNLEQNIVTLETTKAELLAEQQSLADQLFQAESKWTKLNEAIEVAQKKLLESHQTQELEKTSAENPVVATNPVAQDFRRRFNQMLKEERAFDWRLEDVASVSEGICSAVMLYQIGTSGVIAGGVYGNEMKVILPSTADAIWLEIYDGYIIREGRKEEFAGAGYRVELAPIHLERWKQQLPELFVTGKEKRPSGPEADGF